MGCNHTFNTIDDAFGLFTWLYFGLFFYVFGMFFTWRPTWYSIIQKYTYFAIPDRVYLILTLVLTELNAYAAWRIWVCEDWDVYFIPLFFGMLMMLFMNFFPFVLMVTKYASAYALAALAFLAIAVVFMIFAFIKDTTAGVIAIFDVLLALIYLAFSLWALAREDKLHRGLSSHIEKRQSMITPVIPPVAVVTDQRSAPFEMFGFEPLPYQS